MNPLIEEKKEIFDDFRIPWSEAIEWKFEDAIASCPNSDPEVILDNIAKPYFEKAFLHPLETYAEWLKEKYYGRSLTKRTIIKEIGEDYFNQMLKSGMLKAIPKTRFYIIEEGK